MRPTLAARVALAWLAVATVSLPSTARSQSQFAADTILLGPLVPLLRASSPLIVARRAEHAVAQARAQATGQSAPYALAAELEEVPPGFDIAGARSASLELSREFNPGLSGARRALALNEIERAQLELDLAERLVMARAIQHLVQAGGGVSVASRLASEDSLLVSAEQVLQVRFAAGDARYVDVLRLRTERLRIQSERAMVLTEARAARGRLLALLAPPDSLRDQVAAVIDSVIAIQDLTVIPANVTLPSSDALLATSGASRRGALAIERAHRASDVDRAERRSAIIASVGVQRFERDSGHSVGPKLGLSFTLPFLTSGTNRAAHRASAQGIVAAQALSRATLAQTQASTAAAQDRYETVISRVALYDAALLRGARDERESALAAYRSGELSLLELLDFERALARAEIDRLRSYVDAADAKANLIAALIGTTETFEEAQP